MTQHTLNPLATEAADYDSSVVDENGEYGVWDTSNDQENFYVDLENTGQPSRRTRRRGNEREWHERLQASHSA